MSDPCRQTSDPGPARQAGPTVHLVGAGPGDPRLITLRGVECLQAADYVLYDGLVNVDLLRLAPQAEHICVGKHGKSPTWQQSQINAEMVRLAKSGHRVVRLKGGDPAVFARTAEELAALEENHIPYEVVPGITAALAVAGYAGIPLTHRDFSSAVALVTGQQQDDAPIKMDWQALAKFPGSLCIYMGVTTCETWAGQLIEGGKSPDTPAAIVRRCSWNDQQLIYCRLGELTGYFNTNKLRPPVTIIIGEVAHLGQNWNWFERQPLRGLGVWLPRPQHQSDSLHRMLVELGANVFDQPVVRIEPPSDTSDLALAQTLLKQRALDGITFSSANGVDGLLRYLFDQGNDARLLASVRLAAVGPATAKQLEAYGLKADVVPDTGYSADDLLKKLGSSVEGEHWLVTKSNRSRNTLPDGLRRVGAKVTECLAYSTVAVSELPSSFANALEASQIHYAMITSGHIGEVAAGLLGPLKQSIQPIALSSQVADTLQQIGWPAAAIASTNTTDALVEVLLSRSRLPSRI